MHGRKGLGTRLFVGYPRSQALSCTGGRAWERGYLWGTLVPRLFHAREEGPGNEAICGVASFPGSFMHGRKGLGTRLFVGYPRSQALSCTGGRAWERGYLWGSLVPRLFDAREEGPGYEAICGVLYCLLHVISSAET